MADEINDDRFKSEVMRLLSTLIVKVDGIEKDVSEVKSDVKVLKGQFNDIAVMAIKDNKRITKLETEVEDLKGSIH